MHVDDDSGAATFKLLGTADAQWEPPESLAALYRSMARAFARLSGWRVVVLSGSPVWTREVRSKPAVTHKLFNGSLEVRMLAYEMRDAR